MAKFSTYKAHETRMWVKDILIPAIGLIGCVAAIPENRQKAREIYEGAKMKVKESRIYQMVFQK